MIKKFKLFEKINDGKPEVGDYVICKLAYQYFERQDELNLFFENNIGQITHIIPFTDGSFQYDVRFENIPQFHFRSGIFSSRKRVSNKNVGNKIFNVRRKGNNEIVAWSKDRKELEIKIEANKFGL